MDRFDFGLHDMDVLIYNWLFRHGRPELDGEPMRSITFTWAEKHKVVVVMESESGKTTTLEFEVV